jgi:hypothetical protein
MPYSKKSMQFELCATHISIIKLRLDSLYFKFDSSLKFEPLENCDHTQIKSVNNITIYP